MKTLSTKTFTVDEHLSVECRSERTRSGFRHLATLSVDGYDTVSAKCTYQNRTWESYEFQSVLEALARKVTDGATKDTLVAFAHDYQEGPDPSFRMLAGVMALGEIFSSGQAQANDWKARMLRAGLGDRGLDMPEDWDTLPEDEKTRRLDGVIAELSAP